MEKPWVGEGQEGGGCAPTPLPFCGHVVESLGVGWAKTSRPPSASLHTSPKMGAGGWRWWWWLWGGGTRRWWWHRVPRGDAAAGPISQLSPTSWGCSQQGLGEQKSPGFGGNSEIGCSDSGRWGRVGCGASRAGPRALPELSQAGQGGLGTKPRPCPPSLDKASQKPGAHPHTIPFSPRFVWVNPSSRREMGQGCGWQGPGDPPGASFGAHSAKHGSPSSAQAGPGSMDLPEPGRQRPQDLQAWGWGKYGNHRGCNPAGSAGHNFWKVQCLGEPRDEVLGGAGLC